MDYYFSSFLFTKLKIMKTTQINLITWILLVILILSSYFFSETHFKYATLGIAILSLIKFFAVSFQFMETKNAHRIWQVLISFVGFTFLSLILFFY